MFTRHSSNTLRDNPTKHFCDNYQFITNHKTLTSITKYDYHEHDETGQFTETTTYETIACCGCDKTSFLETYENSEMWDPKDEQTIKRYPELSSKRKPFNGLSEIPQEIQRIYQETYWALINGSKILTGIGIRAIIETTCREHQIKGSNLQERIENLAKQKGTITEEGREALQQLRFLGNNAAHENKPHSEEELNSALEIVDHILQALYVFSRRLQSLKTKIPKKNNITEHP